MASLAEHAPSPPPAKEMAWIPAGRFSMGSEDFYPEERPVHQVSLGGFWMDEHPVTAAEFRRFVRETGYVTVAERPLDPDQYPDADPPWTTRCLIQDTTYTGSDTNGESPQPNHC